MRSRLIVAILATLLTLPSLALPCALEDRRASNCQAAGLVAARRGARLPCPPRFIHAYKGRPQYAVERLKTFRWWRCATPTRAARTITNMGVMIC